MQPEGRENEGASRNTFQKPTQNNVVNTSEWEYSSEKANSCSIGSDSMTIHFNYRSKNPWMTSTKSSYNTHPNQL